MKKMMFNLLVPIAVLFLLVSAPNLNSVSAQDEAVLGTLSVY
jgi:hypothetical protein